VSFRVKHLLACCYHSFCGQHARNEHGKLACFIVTPLEHRNQRNRFLIVLSEIPLHLFGECRKPRPISAARGRVSDLRLEAL
jgi:hypothetical protein